VNNIATSIAEQPAPSEPPRNFLSQEEQARLWAEKAISVSEQIVPPDRTDECATGCATAKANIAELLERKGQLQDAQRLFRDAEEIASSVGFTEGVQIASSGRKRVLQELRKRG
jgi:hypothetical protein